MPEDLGQEVEEEEAEREGEWVGEKVAREDWEVEGEAEEEGVKDRVADTVMVWEEVGVPPAPPCRNAQPGVMVDRLKCEGEEVREGVRVAE